VGKASNIILAGFACAATACCVVAASAAAEPVPTKPSACIADLRDRLFAGEFGKFDEIVFAVRRSRPPTAK